MNKFKISISDHRLTIAGGLISLPSRCQSPLRAQPAAITLTHKLPSCTNCRRRFIALDPCTI